VLKRAKYFITCGGKAMPGLRFTDDEVLYALMSAKELAAYKTSYFLNDGSKQLSLFETPELLREDLTKCLTGQM
jgi:predicted DNA-binding helix-hairpin-helix protein